MLPGNVLFNEAGSSRVVDFGFETLIGSRERSVSTKEPHI
jgi:hypothetical protein